MAKNSLIKENASCPCGSAKLYARCCGQLHAGACAPTAEALMRSRYSAFVIRDEAYLRRSWFSETCPQESLIDTAVQWRSLNILNTEAGQPQDAEGIVHFVVSYKVNGRAFKLEERSRFVREQGEWRYLDGDFPEEANT